MSDVFPQGRLFTQTGTVTNISSFGVDAGNFFTDVGRRLRIVSGIISVTTAAVGGDGEIELQDKDVAGADEVFIVNSDSVGFHTFDFGPKGIEFSRGINWISSATTTGADATITFDYYSLGPGL